MWHACFYIKKKKNIYFFPPSQFVQNEKEHGSHHQRFTRGTSEIVSSTETPRRKITPVIMPPSLPSSPTFNRRMTSSPVKPHHSLPTYRLRTCSSGWFAFLCYWHRVKKKKINFNHFWGNCTTIYNTHRRRSSSTPLPTFKTYSKIRKNHFHYQICFTPLLEWVIPV